MNYVICNLDQKPFFSKLMSKFLVANFQMLNDLNQIKTVFSNPLKDTGFIIIDVTSSFYQSSSSLTSFNGFEIAADLRRLYKIKNPIIYHSYFPAKYFEAIAAIDIRFKIIFGSGSTFLQYPYSKSTFEEAVLSVKTLTTAALQDVIIMLCNLKGVVLDKLNHDLSYESNLTSVKKLFKSIENYLSAKQIINLEWNNYIIKITKSIKNQNKEEFITLKQSLLKVCELQLNQESKEIIIDTKPVFKILLVDDRVEELIKNKELFSKKFIVESTTHANQAIEILKADTYNQILVVICDWRLYETENLTFWQPLQGYDVLNYASKNGIRALFAITGQVDYIVHEIRNLMNIRFKLIKKENIASFDQFQLFIDVLQEACLEIENTILNQPRTANWRTNVFKKKVFEYSLKELYELKRNDLNYFEEIQNNSDQLWEKLINNEEILSFLPELSTSKIDESLLNSVLIIRRLYLGLYYRNYEISQISRQIFNKDNKGDITQHRSKLCIELNDLKNYKILPEERAWLIKKGILNVGNER